MKICLFSSVYALSEDDKHAAFLVESNRHLLEQGHEVHVLAPSFEGLKSHVIKGVKVHRFRYFFAKWEHLTHGEGAPNRVQNIFYLMIAAFYILFGTIAAIRPCTLAISSCDMGMGCKTCYRCTYGACISWR